MHFIQSCVPTKAHQLREQHNLTGGDYSHRSEDLVRGALRTQTAPQSHAPIRKCQLLAHT